MLKISDLKKGDVIWECDGGFNVRLEIQSEPQHITELNGWPAVGWHVLAANEYGVVIDLFEADQSYGHGLSLYREPAYFNGKQSWPSQS